MREVFHDFDLSYLKHLGRSREDLNRREGTNNDFVPIVWKNLARMRPNQLFNFFIVNPGFTAYPSALEMFGRISRADFYQRHMMRQVKLDEPLEDNDDFWKYVVRKQNPNLYPKWGQKWKQLFEDVNGFFAWKLSLEDDILLDDPVDLVDNSLDSLD